jgi:hypothetical protein
MKRMGDFDYKQIYDAYLDGATLTFNSMEHMWGPVDGAPPPGTSHACAEASSPVRSPESCHRVQHFAWG